MKRIRRFLSLVLLMTLLFSCTAAQAVAQVKLNKTKATIYNSQCVQLKLKNAKGSVTWKTSNKKVATVNTKGKVTGKGPGTATITAVNGKKKYTCQVTVLSVLAFGKKSVTVKTGKRTAVDFWFYVDGNFDWRVANPKLLSCDWSGKWTDGGNHAKLYLIGLKAGTTTVKLTNSATKDSVSIKVKVTGETVPIISSDITNVSLKPGASKTVEITALDGGDITWDSSDAGVATCEWGDWEDNMSPLKIIAGSAGVATVTVTHDETGQKVKIKVTVKGDSNGSGTTKLIKGELKDLLGKSADNLETRLRNAIREGDTFYNDKVAISVSNGRISEIMLMESDTNGEYTLYGVHPGDSYYTAGAALSDAGFTTEKIGGKLTGKYASDGRTVQLLPGMVSSGSTRITCIILN